MAINLDRLSFGPRLWDLIQQLNRFQDNVANATVVIPPPGPTPATSVISTTYNCPPTVAVNDVVYLSAADTVDKADADVPSTQEPLIGMVLSKPTAVTAIVQYYGEMPGWGGLTPGATYYLTDVAGVISDVAPTATGKIVQRVGFARSATILVVMVDRDYQVL